MTKKSVERRREPVDWWPDVLPRRFLDWFDIDLFEGERRLRVEESTEGDEIVVRAEMPGIDPEKDVDVHVRNHTLEIRAERREETETTDKDVKRTEFRYGSFYRAIPLPPDASEADVRATYKDGILEVRVPRDKKQAEATKIAVERA